MRTGGFVIEGKIKSNDIAVVNGFGLQYWPYKCR